MYWKILQDDFSVLFVLVVFIKKEKKNKKTDTGYPSLCVSPSPVALWQLRWAPAPDFPELEKRKKKDGWRYCDTI